MPELREVTRRSASLCNIRRFSSLEEATFVPSDFRILKPLHSPNTIISKGFASPQFDFARIIA
jgi:hypothetical protein